MNVIDLPELRCAAQLILMWSDQPIANTEPDWSGLANAVSILRDAARSGRIARIVYTLTANGPPNSVEDALRDLADLASIPRPARLERVDQLRLPL